MLKRFYRLAISGIVIVFLFTLTLSTLPVKAQSEGCSAEVSPHLTNPITDDQGFFFTATNLSLGSVRWLKISRPSSNFVINEASNVFTGESGTTTNNTAIFSNLDLTNGYGLQIQVGAAVGINETALADWQVQMSTSEGGSNPTSCSGYLSTAVFAYAQQGSGYGVNNAQAVSISDTSVTIEWDSDVPSSSMVLYDTSTDLYNNKTQINGSLVSHHSINVTGLTPETAYHYQAAGTDADGRPYFSADGTFLTAQALPPGPNQNLPNSTPIPIKKTPTEKEPPTVTLATPLNKSYVTAPQINGVAKDNEAVADVEYSTDGGQNWLPVNTATGFGTKQAIFSFTPVNLDDGNYSLIVRAIDTSGNIGMTSGLTLIIDRLPPLVGGALVSLGPQILTPDSNNVITTLTGIDQKITMSAVGGPTSITINANQVGNKTNTTKAFSLTQSIDSGLWSGILSFQQSGVYSLVANSIDGAGNKTSHQLNTINVSSVARVVGQGTNKALKAELKLYTYDIDTGSWIVWDGSPFGQTNPQTTGTNGSFKLFLPPGKYYLAVTAKGYKPLVSNIFNLGKTTPLTTQLSMAKTSGLNLGPIHLGWPNFSSQAININPKVPKVAQSANPNKLMNKSFPDVTLPGTDSSKVNSISWLGRPTLLSFMVSWLPSTSEQLKPLSELQTNKDINIVPIALQENSDKMRVYTQTAGYSLNWLVDPDSTLTDVVNIQSLPTHYFINRDGIVKKVVTGILSKQQIIDNLSSL